MTTVPMSLFDAVDEPPAQPDDYLGTPYVPGHPDGEVPPGQTERARANVTAARLLAAILGDDRPATPAEQLVLARWSGWGAVPAVLDDRHPEHKTWAHWRPQIAELLTAEAYRAACRSVLNAHYTRLDITQAMWNAAEALGFTAGKVLEPGCGSGNFIGLAPAGAQMTGIELEPVTAGIAQVLYPNATVFAESFADTRLPDGYFDLVVGNVPFADIALTDRRHNRSGHSVHNHFIVKGLHLLAPGGIMIVITSRYTMDSANPAARREIAGLADLLGAVRLPTGSHQKQAGTKAIMDVLVLRRRPEGMDPSGPQWGRSEAITWDGVTDQVNEYFQSHPDNIIGEMHGGSAMYRPGMVITGDSAGVASQLAAVLKMIAIGAKAARLGWAPQHADADESGDAGGGYAVHPNGHVTATEDGGFAEAWDGTWRRLPVPPSQVAEMTALLRIRDAELALLRTEADEPDDTPELDELRAGLNAAYDDYTRRWGCINRFTERIRVDADGVEHKSNWRPRGHKHFRGDPHYPTVCALEIFDPGLQTAEKTPIFSRRTQSPRTAILGVDTPAEALAVCMDRLGHVDLDEIASLLGCRPEQAASHLDGLVFEVPPYLDDVKAAMSDPPAGRLVPAAVYLSGNVRARLTVAEAAAEMDDRFRPNVTRLRQVIPADLPPGDIEVRLGGGWIPADVIQQFLAEILDDSSVRVHHPAGPYWSVVGRMLTPQATATWGTPDMNAITLAESLLMMRRIQVFDKVKDKLILNVDATLAAQEKAARMGERFATWVWEDEDRAARLARIYNDLFNCLVRRTYDDVRMELPGLSDVITPHKHQRVVAARMVYEPTTGMFHEVGLGKTYAMAIGVMELRRLRLISKACIAVPNHMLEQFSREWIQAYPQARVLVATKDELGSRQLRKRFAARAATGDWDAIIVSHSAFTRIPMPRDVQEDYYYQEIERLEEWIEAAKNSDVPVSMRAMERTKWLMEERIKKLLDKISDDGIFFTELGCDYLCFDEADVLKNLRTPSNISDAVIQGSIRASDADMKLSWLRQHAKSQRVATFATGTPVANAVAEMWVMMHYLRPDLLQDAGMDIFDLWAANHGVVETRVELAPEGGTSFHMKERLSRYVNVPEMQAMFSIFADVMGIADSGIKVPLIRRRAEDGERVPENVIVEATPEQEDFVRLLGQRASAIRSGGVDPREDNMLKISTQGRLAALDMRCLGLDQCEPGKIEAVADRVIDVWQRHPGNLQLVFCDMSTPKDEWNVYDELTTQLMERGMPLAGIRYIHQAKTDRDKAQLFAECRTGRVAVLMGSTDKMGVGVNVQARCIALHDVDAPWRPRDVAQRAGRIIRQGNSHDEVYMFRYVTKGTFDAFMWQCLTRKATFIGQVVGTKCAERTITDIGDVALSFAEVTALATGNMLLMDKAEADGACALLERAERAHVAQMTHLKWGIKAARSNILYAQERITALATAITRRDAGRDRPWQILIDGTEFAADPDAGGDGLDAAREEAGKALRTLIGEQMELTRRQAIREALRRHNIRTRAGWLHGTPFQLTTSRNANEPMGIDLALEDVPVRAVSMKLKDAQAGSPAELVSRLEAIMDRLPARIRDEEESVTRQQEQINGCEKALLEPFARAEELAAARVRCKEVNAAIAAQAASNGRAASDKVRADLEREAAVTPAAA